MRSNKIKYMLTPMIAAAALLWACDSDGGSCPNGSKGTEGDGPTVIQFRGSGEGLALSRAVDGFPNNTIGVTATYADSPGDWTVYEDIINANAKVDGQTGGVYSFSWDTDRNGDPDRVKYWPLDGTRLLFAAYSPHVSESDDLALLHDNTHLAIELSADLPDVMYASGNSLLKKWSKSDGTVDLGTFNHALSQLTVNVTAEAGTNPGITIESIEVKTSRGSAVLDLLAGDEDNLTFIVVPDYSYQLVGSTPATFTPAKPFTKTVYLFPGTEDQTQIIITLTDSTYSLTATHTLSDIPSDNNAGEYLDLVRAKNTEVNFLVRSTSVQDPDPPLTIKGALTDWIPMGDLEVIIN